jgi:hypothetical protein
MLGWNDDVDEAPDADEKNLIREVLSRTALCLDHNEAERTTIYTLLALVAVFMFEIGGEYLRRERKKKKQERFYFSCLLFFFLFSKSLNIMEFAGQWLAKTAEGMKIKDFDSLRNII